MFLTADHAAVPNPSYLEDLKIPSGYFKTEEFKKYVRTLTLKYFNSDKIVENISNYQIFLNKEEIKSLGFDVNKVEQIIADEIINFDKVYKSITAHTLQTAQFSSGLMQSIQNGYNQKFSGDILFVPMPGVISHGITGTTHGSGYNYDTHVPLIFYGKGIKTGSSNVYYPITNIAPTLSSLLNIEEPDGCTGRPIIEVLK